MWSALFILTLFTALTFINSWHDALIFDDELFLGPGAEQRLESLVDAFGRDLWQGGGELYRPLLSIDFELQSRLFGAWKEGYHLVNILLHLVTTLALFGFLRYLLRRTSPASSSSEFYALLAALVFAVHPVHTEVVNSVFNKSSMYVSLAAITGLWWLLAKLQTHPVRAWVGFGLIYCVAILYKESALVLPGIAVAMIVFLTDGQLNIRIRRFLPVFWLLIPIAAYFWARSVALAAIPPGSETLYEAGEVFFQPGNNSLVIHLAFADGLAQFGRGLKILVWPYPLRLYYSTPSDVVIFTYITLQVILLAWAIWLLIKGRAILAFSLLFYYLTLLPSIRLIGIESHSPHLSERYLYLPSVGLTIALAFGFQAICTRLTRKHLLIIMLPPLLALATISWQRNADWKSTVLLFETEYQHGSRGYNALRVLAAAHFHDQRYGRVVEICDDNPSKIQETFDFLYSCANSYIEQGREPDAIAVLESHALHGDDWISAQLALASIYRVRRQYQKVVEQYAAIIDRVAEPAIKNLFKAEMLLAIYPDDRQQLELARRVFQQALALNPELHSASERIRLIDEKLAKMNSH